MYFLHRTAHRNACTPDIHYCQTPQQTTPSGRLAVVIQYTILTKKTPPTTFGSGLRYQPKPWVSKLKHQKVPVKYSPIIHPHVNPDHERASSSWRICYPFRWVAHKLQWGTPKQKPPSRLLFLFDLFTADMCQTHRPGKPPSALSFPQALRSWL